MTMLKNEINMNSSLVPDGTRCPQMVARTSCSCGAGEAACHAV
jgi:hypothetical protein